MENKVYYGEYSLKHWIDLILSQNIILPEYQRYFVWDEKKVETLIKAFKEKQFVPPVTIGSFHENNKSSNLVLDGQQRLTSILLSYLKVYPNKDSFIYPNSNTQMYSDSVENASIDENEASEDEIDEMLDWNFTKLQLLGSNKEEILGNLGEQYKNIDYRIDDEFFENNYLGFSFLVPHDYDVKVQQKYYSSVFRAINIQGETLLPQETRASLYYLNKDLKSYFDPDFIKTLRVDSNSKSVHIDFVRYLSLLSQYLKTQDSSKVARGFGKKDAMEEYYEEYIYSVVSDNESNLFGKFSETILESEIEDRLNQLKLQLSDIFGLTKEYSSIIEADLALFGLIYFVLLKGDLIDLLCKQDLIDELSSKTNEFRDNDAHSKSPNKLGNLRKRIESSIEIYGRHLREST